MSDELAGELRGHVERLAGTIGERNVWRPRALASAAGTIEDVWRGQGYEVARQWYLAAGERCTNLEVARAGSGAGTLVIGAHYDTVPGSPGANDNASGVAALLAITRLFRELNPALTVRFVAFVNEEPPFFLTGQQGSMVYARAARRRGDDIRLMVSLETIGCYSDAPGSQRYPPFFRLFYPDRGNFIGLVSDFRSRRRMLDLAEAYRAASDFPLEHVATFRFIPGVSWSDHWSFWRCGFRALMVTDTAFYRYPHYHTPADTPDKLAYPEFARMTAGLARALAHLATTGLP